MSVKTTRNVNIELLRIILMFMILSLHANFVALGVPDFNSFKILPLDSIVRTFLESLCIGAVNVFILISGWFEIKFSIKKLSKLLFQCLFFSVFIYVCSSIYENNISIIGFFKSILLLANFWFVKAYLALFIIAPVLNYFSNQASKKEFSLILSFLLIFQLIFGCTNQVSWIQGGYSFYSFVCLYLLARYLNRFGSNFKKYGWKLYILGTLGSFIFFVIGSFFKISNVSILYDISFWYISPFVMIASIGLFLGFLKIDIRGNFNIIKVINKIAISSFAVFLLHGQSYFYDNIFIEVNRYFYFQSFNGGISKYLALPSICLFLILIYIVAILIDQIRIFLWSKLERVLFKKN